MSRFTVFKARLSDEVLDVKINTQLRVREFIKNQEIPPVIGNDVPMTEDIANEAFASMHILTEGIDSIVVKPISTAIVEEDIHNMFINLLTADIAAAMAGAKPQPLTLELLNTMYEVKD